MIPLGKRDPNLSQIFGRRNICDKGGEQMAFGRKERLTCRVCGNPFRAVRRDARYCSAKCRQQFNRYYKKQTAIVDSVLDPDTSPRVIRPKGK